MSMLWPLQCLLMFKVTQPWAFFSFFNQSTTLSSRTVDGHQMYSGASVIGKAAKVYVEFPHPSPNFHRGGQKVRNLALFSTSLNFEPPAFENAARYPNSETNFLCSHDCAMSSPSLVKLGPRTPENRWAEMRCPTP